MNLWQFSYFPGGLRLSHCCAECMAIGSTSVIRLLSALAVGNALMLKGLMFPKTLRFEVDRPMGTRCGVR
jgi:hypothetical protein